MKNRKFFSEFFLLAVPIMLQALTGTLLNICDTIMVGKISENAISAVTVSNKTFLIFSMFIFGVASGISMFMSQYYGANENQNAKRTFKFGIQVCVAVAFIFIAMLVIGPQYAIRLFVKGNGITVLGIQYISIVRWSYLPYAINQICAVYFRVFKKQSLPMKISMISVVINILLNYVLIYGKLGMPILGIKGAALATLISRCMETAMLLTILFFKDSGKEIFGEKNGALDKTKKMRIIKKIIPLMVNEGLYAIALSLIFRNYCIVSEANIPAVTVVDNVYDFVNVAFVGVSQAAGIIIGKVLGTGNMEIAKKTANRLLVIGVTTSVIGSCIIVGISGFVPMLFSLSGGVFAMATSLLRIKAIFSWSQGYGLTIYYILRAGGDVAAVLVLDGLFNLYGPLLVSSILAYFANFSIELVYLCTEATYLMKIILGTWFYKRGRWCRNLTEG